eukprot:TRINITY_DN6718_c0_g1_i1.p1 TRINITY_DN6718_c0_g1~~TRINITY_DN6718_c0_g1_i1.p1  ORF type:complete len:403 (+),score=109.91 TRINITY_DN6718_c0_g1_i1:53-1261(+)
MDDDIYDSPYAETRGLMSDIQGGEGDGYEHNSLKDMSKKKDKTKKKKGHGHSHGGHGGHDHGHSHKKDGKKNKKKGTDRAKIALIVATIFTLIFMVIEIAGGYIAGSLAIMTDAAHLLTDVAAMCLSLFAMYWARKPATKSMTFGYHRAEILGALASIVTIWGLVAVLGYESIMRLIADSRLVGDEVDGRIMTIIGVLGFVVNIIDAIILHWGNAPHGHSHGGGGGGHSHGHGGHGNVNVRAAFIHVVGDCLQSIGVIIAAVIVWVGNHFQYGSPKVAHSYFNLADPIASIIFSIITLITTIRLCKHTVEVLMERVPNEINMETLREEFEGIQGANGVHDLHVWALTVGKIALTVHINSDDHVATLSEAQRICTQHGIGHVTIQVDPAAAGEDNCVGTFHHV